MKQKILSVIKCICLYLIISLSFKTIIDVVNASLELSCYCYDSIFQRKLISFLGYLLSDLIGVFFSIKIVSKKNNLSKNNLIIPVYLIVILLLHPILRDLSYFQVFPFEFSKEELINYSYNSEFEKLIINNFNIVKNVTSIFFIITTILNYSLIISIIKKHQKAK